MASPCNLASTDGGAEGAVAVPLEGAGVTACWALILTMLSLDHRRRQQQQQQQQQQQPQWIIHISRLPSCPRIHYPCRNTRSCWSWRLSKTMATLWICFPNFQEEIWKWPYVDSWFVVSTNHLASVSSHARVILSWYKLHEKDSKLVCFIEFLQ